jgi:ubiquitin-conjugating enzyme E2 S
MHGVNYCHLDCFEQVIRCLLIVPFPESSLNDEAGKLFMESYDEYFRRAKLMTSVHALKKTSTDSSGGGSSTDTTASDSSSSGSSAAAAAASSSGAQSAAETGKASKAKVVKKKALKRL